MSDHKSNTHGNNLNDPKQSPADMADHQQRTAETREESEQTGGQHDDQGHTPTLSNQAPNKPPGNTLKP